MVDVHERADHGLHRQQLVVRRAVAAKHRGRVEHRDDARQRRHEAVRGERESRADKVVDRAQLVHQLQHRVEPVRVDQRQIVMQQV